MDVIETFDKMSTADLVAVLFGRQTVDKECHRLASLLSGDGATLASDLNEIARETGPGGLKRAERVLAAVELGRRNVLARNKRTDIQLDKPANVAEFMAPYYAQHPAQEVFYCLCLSTKNHLKKIYEVSRGSLSASIVHPRELYRLAVECSAASVVVTHNHPSGDPAPSNADISLTRRLVKAGDVLGVELLDHIVLGGGEDNFVSMRDKGLM